MLPWEIWTNKVRELYYQIQQLENSSHDTSNLTIKDIIYPPTDHGEEILVSRTIQGGSVPNQGLPHQHENRKTHAKRQTSRVKHSS